MKYKRGDVTIPDVAAVLRLISYQIESQEQGMYNKLRSLYWCVEASKISIEEAVESVNQDFETIKNLVTDIRYTLVPAGCQDCIKYTCDCDPVVNLEGELEYVKWVLEMLSTRIVVALNIWEELQASSVYVFDAPSQLIEQMNMVFRELSYFLNSEGESPFGGWLEEMAKLGEYSYKDWLEEPIVQEWLKLHQPNPEDSELFR